MLHSHTNNHSFITGLPDRSAKNRIRTEPTHPEESQISSTIGISSASTEMEMQGALALLNRKYAARGYGNTHMILSGSTYKTFIATADSGIVGTATLNVDSEAGMAADAQFRDEINIFRRDPKVKACEITKLAFEVDLPSKPVLAALFCAVFQYNQRHHKCTDLFIEVNPRHRRFYQALLGLRDCGEVKINPAVDAPSQLMHITALEVQAQIQKYSGKTSASIRSLYALFPDISSKIIALH